MKGVLTILLFSGGWTLGLRAQILEFDQNPPNLKWRQIQTERFQVIFPSDFESRAKELVLQLDSLMALVNADLRASSSRTPIIFQNQSVFSNGFVQLAPRRSELVTTPPSGGENQDWLHHLTIHELRHIGQFDRLVGRMRAPFFEQLGLAMFGVHLPNWFYEGDAVWIESRLTPGGRGRKPSWIMPYRTNVLSDKRFSYQKDFMGSYRDVTPGAYLMGYLMVDKMYRELGAEVVERLLSDVSGHLLRPYSFSKALKDLSGLNTRAWHEATLNELEEKWREHDEAHDYQDYRQISQKKEQFPTDLLLPQWTEDGKVLAIRQGSGYVPELVEMDTTGAVSSRVLRLGWQSEPHFSYAAGKITWDEWRTNARYSKQVFNVINVHDLETGRTKQLTHKSRYFAPTLNSAGSQIAAVSVSGENAAALVLLDPVSGEELQRFPAPDGWMLQTPAFDPTSSKVVLVAVSRAGTALTELSLMDGSYRLLTHWEYLQIERPVYAKDGVIFKAHTIERADEPGIDQVYYLTWGAEGSSPERSKLSMLTRSRFGAFNPSIDTSNGRLLFNEYQQGGHQISVLEVDQSVLTPHSDFPMPSAILQVKSPEISELSSSPYGGWPTIFNFHSLSVTSEDFSSLDDINPGLFLLSDNLLNTVQARLGYLYDNEMRSSEYRAAISYQRFFPKFNVSYRNRERSGTAAVQPSTPGGTPEQVGLRWREHVTDFSISVPLSFHRFDHRYSMRFSAGTSLTNRYNLEVDPQHPQAEKNFIQEIHWPFQTSLNVGHSVRSSSLALGPRWGQQIGIGFRQLTQQGVNNGNPSRHIAVLSSFYFPGVMPHHSTHVRMNYQRGAGAYRNINDIPMVSGYDQLQPVAVSNTVLFTYRFPLAYPDWELGNLAYIMRLKGGLFADFENVDRRQPLKSRPKTLGIELRSDMRLLRFFLPHFDLGGRLIYAPASRQFAVTYGVNYSY